MHGLARCVCLLPLLWLLVFRQPLGALPLYVFPLVVSLSPPCCIIHLSVQRAIFCCPMAAARIPCRYATTPLFDHNHQSTFKLSHTVSKTSKFMTKRV